MKYNVGFMPVHSAHKYKKYFVECPLEIPMNLLNEEWAQNNHSQTLKRLAERGGLDPTEILANIERRDWKKIDVVEALKQLLDYLERYNNGI